MPQPLSGPSPPSSAADGAQPPTQSQQDYLYQSSGQSNDCYNQSRPPQIPAATVKRLHSYSAENLLKTGPGGATLDYDPAMRLYQTNKTAITRFGYDGSRLIAEYDGANAVLRRYVHGPALRHAQGDEPLLWYEGAGMADRRWLHSDERGSVIAVSNASGTVTAINAYDEYGLPAATNAGRFQYTGQTWLPELGMYYYKARMYSTTLGRFLQTDPIGYADGLNWYNGVIVDGAAWNGSPRKIDVAAVIYGGAGNDTISGGDLGNDLFGGAGDDVLTGGRLDDWMFGGDGNYLSGGAGNDTLNGAEGSDWLEGGAGVDVLKGGGGDDILASGAGNDVVIEGGSGNDQYLFRRGDGADVAIDKITDTAPGITLGGSAANGLRSYMLGQNALALIRRNFAQQSSSADAGGDDALVLGAGITLSDVFLQRGFSGIDASGTKIANDDLILKNMHKSSAHTAKPLASYRAANNNHNASRRVA
jgi:RHS repeat-associated protein